MSRSRPYNRTTQGCSKTKESNSYCFVTFLSICSTISQKLEETFSDHAVINLKRKIEIFCYKMLVLGNIQKGKTTNIHIESNMKGSTILPNLFDLRCRTHSIIYDCCELYLEMTSNSRDTFSLTTTCILLLLL